MEQLTEDRISGMISSALERIAFVFAEPIDASTEHSANRHASITFESAGDSGTIFLSAEDGFLHELAANLLGVEMEEVSDEESSQALTELANIVGGEIILALGASSIPFQLGLPGVIEAPPTASPAASGACVESEGGVLSVSLEPA